MIPSQLYISRGLTGNDSLEEFIRRTLNAITLQKFTGHWNVTGLMGQERQTNVFPENTSQKSLATVGQRIRKFWTGSSMDELNSCITFAHGFAPASYSQTKRNDIVLHRYQWPLLVGCIRECKYMTLSTGVIHFYWIPQVCECLGPSVGPLIPNVCCFVSWVFAKATFANLEFKSGIKTP